MSSIHTVDSELITTPLYARQTTEGENSIREMGLRGKLNLRGDIENPEFSSAVESVFGVALPVTPNTVNEYESNKVFWLGPNEWLVYCDVDEAGQLQDSLRQQLGEIHFALTEVSDYYTVIRLRGPDAEALIRKGCPMDIHSSVFQAGDIAQTRFGHASILLYKLSDGESWDIQVRWTYAEYVWDYLISGLEAL